MMMQVGHRFWQFARRVVSAHTAHYLTLQHMKVLKTLWFKHSAHSICCLFHGGFQGLHVDGLLVVSFLLQASGNFHVNSELIEQYANCVIRMGTYVSAVGLWRGEGRGGKGEGRVGRALGRCEGERKKDTLG